MEYNKEEKEKIIQAGKIHSQVKKYAKEIIRPGVGLKEIADKIEDKIHELGGRVAFPTNLSINEIAAHYTPLWNDKSNAKGLLKVDIGVHVDGYVADSAFSLDLDEQESSESKENKALIKAANSSLEAAKNTIKNRVKISEIGKEIKKAAEPFVTIKNLTGHQIEQYDLHAGLSIPNYDNESSEEITPGLYAIEPFVSTKNSLGRIKEGKPSEIYLLISDQKPRSQIARNVLNYIINEYSSLPFCTRQIVRSLGNKALIGIRELERNGNLHNFPQLIEVSGEKVAQSEHTFLVLEDDEVITTTE
ncbi:MAG TPA: type II methionyl aminopeptidase [Candidatus Nanoarchaeia archaeon]|nr:type II methionyl aminopeptidase [Candidatus Nanoarchaeia archaeon]